jgi:tRNA (guanine-N7-)-methyltransferase
LFLDIGCAKGKFLLDACARDTDGIYNYLGLEIRPGVAELARQRVPPHLVGRIDFIGCNANVDLHRLLQLYHQHAATTETSSSGPLLLQTVTIQFPDPHFKASHAKRRVVTQSLIATIAEYMPPSGMVFLQSDVQCKFPKNENGLFV